MAALDPLITALQQRGYRFSTIGELEGHSRDLTMPKLGAADLRLARIDSIAFAVNRAFQTFLFWGFSAAIVLGLALNQLVLRLAGSALGAGAARHLAAQLAGMATYTAVNFLTFRFWVFRSSVQIGR